MSQLSDNIKRIRSLLKKKQVEFATSMEVTLDMQKSYESGKAKPDILYQERLAAITGKSLAYLRSNDLTEEDLAQVEKVEEPNNNLAEPVTDYKKSNSELLPLISDLMAKQNHILDQQNSLIKNQTVLLEDRLKNIEANLNGVSEKQRVGAARQWTALELIFGLLLKTQPGKTVEELMDIVDTGSVAHLARKKGIRKRVDT